MRGAAQPSCHQQGSAWVHTQPRACPVGCGGYTESDSLARGPARRGAGGSDSRLTPSLPCLLASCLSRLQARSTLAADAASTEAALLSLRDACPNWEQATEALPGAPWAAGTQPCGSAPDSAWRGIQCSNGTVVAVQLTGLGLAGTLPSNLAGLADLQALNLSGNAFRGSIPVSWMRTDTFPALLDADLSSNRLSGDHALPRRRRLSGAGPPPPLFQTLAAPVAMTRLLPCGRLPAATARPFFLCPRPPQARCR